MSLFVFFIIKLVIILKLSLQSSYLVVKLLELIFFLFFETIYHIFQTCDSLFTKNIKNTFNFGFDSSDLMSFEVGFRDHLFIAVN
jgi:hypothetical protein